MRPSISNTATSDFYSFLRLVYCSQYPASLHSQGFRIETCDVSTLTRFWLPLAGSSTEEHPKRRARPCNLGVLLCEFAWNIGASHEILRRHPRRRRPNDNPHDSRNSFTMVCWTDWYTSFAGRSADGGISDSRPLERSRLRSSGGRTRTTCRSSSMS